MVLTHFGLHRASRVIAAFALCVASFSLPFFRFATAGEAWSVAAWLGVFGVMGAIYAFSDWWFIQRESNQPADTVVVWRTTLIGTLLSTAWVLSGQAMLVYADALPLTFFQEPRLGDSRFWLDAVDRLLLSPIVEETIFRAWLLGPAWQARSLWLRLVISCLVFPLGHLIFEPGSSHDSSLQLWRMLLLFVPSVVFVWVWLRTRSLLACYMTHALFNAVPSLPWWLESSVV